MHQNHSFRMKVYLHDVFEISLNVTSGLCSFAKIIDFYTGWKFESYLAAIRFEGQDYWIAAVHPTPQIVRKESFRFNLFVSSRNCQIG